MVMFMFLAGLAEGIGVLALVPVLNFRGVDYQHTSRAGRFIVGVTHAIGLEPNLAVLLGGIVLAICLKSFLLWLADHQVGVNVARVTRDLRFSLIEALFEVRWRYFAQRKLGQFANAVTMEAVRVAAAYREGCHVLAAFMQMLVYFAIAAAISWQVAVGTLVIGIILTFIYRAFFRRSRAAGGQETDLSKALSSRLMDVLQGLKPLKAMAREHLIHPLLVAETEGLNRAQRRQVFVNVSLKALQEPILTIMLATGLYFLLEVGGQEIGSVLVLTFVFYRLMQHINTIQMRYQIMTLGESAFVSLVDEIEAARSQREQPGGGVQVQSLRKHIDFDHVSFAYDTHPVLQDITVRIPAGAFVAISGGSGSGKSTFADLLLGLLEPTAGEIRIDDVPLPEISIKSWRQTIGYVPQEMLLLNDTVYRNVTVGDETIPESAVVEALTLAGAWEFVREHEKGLHQMVGERGTSLSGGQRQRIAIARALLGKPTLLILDEVTTALDPMTERAICDTLKGLTPQMTILSISHQSAMRERADFELLLEGGVAILQPVEPVTQDAR